MNHGRTVFSQLISFLPDREFRRCVERYRGDQRLRDFTCWNQYLAMAFAQLTYRESLRDIEACLGSLQGKLYHLGFRGTVARSTLADANESRDWRIFADFAQRLITTARRQYASEPMGVDLDQSLYALDSTTIDLCLSLFPWAKFRKHKAAVKMHTLLDLRGNIPTFIRVTDGKVHDVNLLDEIMPEAGAFYVMDRGYIDFERLFVLTLNSAFFVVRTKSNVLLQRRYSHPVDKSTGVRSDQTIILTSFESASAYPDALRRVSYFDAETGKRLKFLTNNFTLPAHTVAQIYKQRWQVGVSSQGHINQPVQVRPRLIDSSLVAWEASWSESETMKPSDNMLRKEYAQLTRLQRAVNADVASLHANPEAETVDNARKQQEPIEMSPMRRLSPAGYQRRHGEKENVETGEALGVRRRNLVEEATAITASGKCRRRRQGGGSGRTTVDGRAAKRVRRKGPGPVSLPLDKVRQG
jgi:hypothetical protein